MVSLPLMIEREMYCDRHHGERHGAHSDYHDAEILADCRRKVSELLVGAELTLDALEGNGWQFPDDDDAITYAMRLLLATPELDELTSAIQLAQVITFTPNGDPS